MIVQVRRWCPVQGAPVWVRIDLASEFFDVPGEVCAVRYWQRSPVKK